MLHLPNVLRQYASLLIHPIIAPIIVVIRCFVPFMQPERFHPTPLAAEREREREQFLAYENRTVITNNQCLLLHH